MILKIPGDLIDAPDSRWLKVGNICFGEYQQKIAQKPRNVFITEHTLILVTKGAKVFRFPDREIIVEAGKAIFLQRGCYLLCESLTREQNYESISIFFNEEVLRDFWISLQPDLAFIKAEKDELEQGIILDMSPELEGFRETIINSLTYKGKLLEQIITLKLKELLLLLIDSDAGPKISYFFNEIFYSGLPDPAYVVASHLLKPLTLSDYAALSQRSLSAFKRAFQEKKECSPGQWILEKRLEHSRALLKTTDKTINEISELSGFTNASSFIRAYRKRYSITPKAERDTGV